MYESNCGGRGANAIAMWATVCILTGNAMAGAVVYVDDDAPPNGNGSSWQTAFNDLQLALAIVKEGDEIHVAQGIYKPAPPNGSRDATFNLIDGVIMRGGYAGINADDPDLNDPVQYKSLLTGDLNGDDGPNFQNSTENSYNVVTADGVGPTSQLRGVTIRAGNADYYDSYWTDRRMFGGGISGINGATVTLIDCVVRDNQSKFGGGGGIRIAGITLTNCKVIANKTSAGSLAPAGGLWIDGEDALIEDCLFQSNWADNAGGAIYRTAIGSSTAFVKRSRFINNFSNEAAGALAGSRYAVIDCDFIGNSGLHGAGAFQGGSSEFTNSRFLNNFGGCSTVVGQGSAIGSYGETSVINCMFSGNKGSFGVFVVYSQSATNPDKIINCTFVGNESMYCGGGGAIRANHGTVVMNTVIWGNQSEVSPPGSNPVQESQINAVAGTTLQSNIIEGWDGSLGGIGNHGNNPRFINAAGSDGIYGTEDDNPRLLPHSPMIDLGSMQVMPSDSHDLDEDGDATEPIPFDIDGLPRFVGSSVDVGAYEFQGTPCPADLTGTGSVNAGDLLAVLNAWGACVPGQQCNTDLTLDGMVNASDLLVVLNHWGQCP